MCDSAKCCLSFTRIMLIIFNILFWFGSLALIGLGIWLLVDPNVINLVGLTGSATNSNLLRVSAILILSSGCALFLLSILGCLGAIFESKILLGIYIALLVLLFCIEVIGAILAIAFKDWLIESLEITLLDTLKPSSEYYYEYKHGDCAASSNGALWDFVQIKMNCCGIYDSPHTGYERLTYSLQNTCKNVTEITNRPLTCCMHNTLNASEVKSIDSDHQSQYASRFNCASIKTQGCLSTIESWIGHYAPVLIGIGFGVAFLQVLGFLFAVCVCVNASRSHWRSYKRQY